MKQLLVLAIVTIFSSQSFSSEPLIKSVTLSTEAFATLEDESEFENKHLDWIATSQDEFSRKLKGRIEVLAGQQVDLGPVSIKLSDSKVILNYGNFSSVSFKPPTTCKSSCTQVVSFSFDDGDYPVYGDMTIEYFLN